MASSPQWRFRPMHPGEMNIDPIEAEFFSTEALGSLADALVREAIQNSLDGRRSGERLTMRFLFPHSRASLHKSQARLYLDGLVPHLLDSRSGLSAQAQGALNEPLSFIAIEDFGTRGLQGDPEQSEDDDVDPAQAARNDFFYFWRNIGRSRKHATDLGRWGLGKTVFQAASRINSFFGLTIRANDQRRLLLGQSVLKIHKVAGQRFCPYGYFGHFSGDFALPVETATELDEFASAFGLKRDSRPGLSVVLPYPDSELTPTAIIDSVLRHYFMPILAGDLTVEVDHDGTVDLLDTHSLPRWFTQSSTGARSSLHSVFSLAQWLLGLPPAQVARLAPPPEAAAPRWIDDYLDHAALTALRDKFDAAQAIAIAAPIWVRPVGGQPVLSEFHVYLQRDETLERAEEHFVRDGITVTGVRSGLPRGVRCIVLIRDRALSGLLGDSENPAHTEWQERSLKFRGRYHHGAFTLRYVRNTPRELVRILTRPAEGRDYSLLKQLFSLEVPTEAQLALRTAIPDTAGSGEDIAASTLEAVDKEHQFALQKLRGGFRIKGTSNQGDRPTCVAVWVAYDVRRGNPFRQYLPLDFDLGTTPIEIKGRNVTVTACQGNQLVLRSERPDFELTVRGFDQHRDLRVKILPAKDQAA